MSRKRLFRRAGSLCLTFFILNVLSASTMAANWLMLQGTEPKKAPKTRPWGFVQGGYTWNRAPALSGLTLPPLAPNNGKTVAANLVGPELEDESQFHVRRARIGVRGKINNKINYFSLIEVANNGMTYDPFGGRSRPVALSDLSITFNHIKGARIRAGMFKTPGPEEPLQAIHTLDYIEFTDFINREQLERFVTGAQPPAASPAVPGTPTSKGYGFSAFRDWGVQVFDSFKTKGLDLSYAVMVGRGESPYSSDDDDFRPEVYLYLSAEKYLPGGKGPFKNGVKAFAWYQNGERTFSSDPTEAKYDRRRYGIGVKARGKLFGSKYKHRFGAELMWADGMIFLAPAGNVPGGNLQYAAQSGNKAMGWYIDYGFYLNKHWEFDIRYDRDHLLYETAGGVDPGNERVIQGLTFGVQYHFTPLMRLTVNYIMREAKAPTAYVGGPPPLTANVRRIVSNLDNRIAAQFSWIFRL